MGQKKRGGVARHVAFQFHNHRAWTTNLPKQIDPALKFALNAQELIQRGNYFCFHFFRLAGSRFAMRPY